MSAASGQTSFLARYIYCTPTFNRKINKPPLSENDGIKVLQSRVLSFRNKRDKTYYFDLMIEEATGIRFVKISEVIGGYRTHILVAFDNLHDLYSLLQKGKYHELDEGKAYATLKDSKVFEDKSYDFIIWEANILGERDHIEICETGKAYPHLIKNRHQQFDTGKFRILISKNKLPSFLAELDELILDMSL